MKHGLVQCCSQVCSGSALPSEQSLGSVDVVIPVGVDLCEIFQHTMQWLLSAALPFLFVLLLVLF